LIQIFLKEFPRHLSILEEAIRAKQWETIQRTAHSLKGELGYMGMTDASKRAKALEGMGRANQLERADELFRSLKSELLSVAFEMSSSLDPKLPLGARSRSERTPIGVPVLAPNSHKT
jgi:HPt (histidine-containing phosphotransfer) domain-containing protein